jgi:hypothetical protein
MTISTSKLGLIVHCNPSYMEGLGRRIMVWGWLQAKNLRLYLKKRKKLKHSSHFLDSASVIMWPYFTLLTLLLGTLLITLGHLSNPEYSLHLKVLNFITSSKPPFPSKVTYTQVLRILTWTSWEGYDSSYYRWSWHTSFTIKWAPWSETMLFRILYLCKYSGNAAGQCMLCSQGRKPHSRKFMKLSQVESLITTGQNVIHYPESGWLVSLRNYVIQRA